MPIKTDNTKKTALTAALSVCTLTAPLLHAADHKNLEEGLPVEIEDAYPIAYGGLELQGQFRFDRADDGNDRFVLDPRLEFGFPANTQIKIAAPFRNEDGAPMPGSGDVGLEALYNFNQEVGAMPALATSVRADLPTGEDSEGVDWRLKFIATKTLPGGARNVLHRLHANAAASYNAQAQPNERTDFYTGTIGYSFRVGAQNTVIVDLVRKEEKTAGEESNLAELGWRYQFSPLTVLSTGVAAGIGDDSPNFRLVTAFQYSIGAPKNIPAR